MKIARVFITKTSMTPDDKDVFIGEPDMFVLKGYYDEIHISVTFTWDIKKVDRLQRIWSDYGKVRVGGPAYGDRGNGFKSGMYLKRGVTITSRGCPNKCGFCLVPKREGGIREIQIEPGNIIQDNNILACSERHLVKVGEMLKQQRAIEFKGGLESSRVTPSIAQWLTNFKIKSLWVACDSQNAIPGAVRAINELKRVGFNQNKIFCYCLIGKDMDEEAARMLTIFNAGAMPFAQLFRNDKDDIEYSSEWKLFQRSWSRPAAIKVMCKEVCNE